MADSSAELERQFAQFQRNLGFAALAVSAFGGLAIVVHAVAQPTGAWLVFSGASMGAAASVAIGALLGFLFGIPKTLQSEQLGEKHVRYLTNTNLEQISDWLTKILVGIGLIQLAQAPERLSQLGTYIAPLFGVSGSGAAFALLVCAYFVTSGFLLCYLWTRAFLRRFLQAADDDISGKIQEEIESREAANTRALDLFERQINGQNSPSQKEIDAAFKDASSTWLSIIYMRAEGQRRQSWRTDKAVISRLIPIFRALSNTPDSNYAVRHDAFGSLGFALKDAALANYSEAIAALTRAIELRGPADESGYVLYEWNRAVCRIRLDAEFNAGASTEPALARLISEDLRVASRLLPRRFFERGEDADADLVARWIEVNSDAMSEK